MGRLKVKNILVTGGAGFIGSHLTDFLLAKGYKVVIPFVTIEPFSYLKTKKLEQKVVLEKCNIVDKDILFQLIQKNSIDFIMHLGAQTLVTRAYEKPVETLETNIIGTVNVLEAARTFSHIKGVIVASSDKAYGKTDKAYTETSPLRGDHPYDVSKSCADLISHMYFRTYQTPVVITRFGNVYGEGDLHFDRIVPGLCAAAGQNKPLEIRSDGTYIRDYIYVKDVISGYYFLFKQFEKIVGQAFNFSSEDSFSVLELLTKAESVLNKKITYTILNTAKNEIPYQHLDDTKIRKLGWKTTHTFSETITDIFSWYTRILPYVQT